MDSDQYEYDRYEVKLSRLMNIQKDFRLFLKMLVGYIFVAVVNIFAGNEDISFFVLLMCIYIVLVFVFLFRNPGRLEITRTTIQFSYLN